MASSSDGPEEQFVTLIWKDDKVLLGFHGSEDDNQYEVWT